MDNDTLKPKAEYGVKAYANDENIPNSTYIRVNRKIDIKISYNNGVYFDSGFRKVDFSDQQKKNTFRRINKMLGGY